MKVAIIGAGKMGRWFAKFFREEGMQVILSDKDSKKLEETAKELNVEAASNVEAVKKADMILICVPIESFEEVIVEIHSHVHPKHEIMDICSVKEKPVAIMHKYISSGTILGTHPMFGPGVKSIKGQNFILTPTNLNEEKLAEDFGKWLESKGAKVFKMTPKEHDELMSIVIGLPYFLSLAACDTMLSCGRFEAAKKVAGASYRFLLTLAQAIASEDENFSATLQMSLPEADKVEELFVEKAIEWLDIVKRKDRLGFAEKMRRLKSKLEENDPKYPEAYEEMYKMLEALKNGN